MSTMQAIQLPDTSSWDGVVALSNLGVIVAQGEDAGTFLHGQFSQDMQSHPAEQTRLAAYCSPKGRMLASFQTLRPEPDAYWLMVDAGVLPAALKRLSMFVLRAKCKLRDASAELKALGLIGPSAAKACEGRVPGQAWHDGQGGQWLRLPDVLGVNRCLWVGPSAQCQAVLEAAPAQPSGAWAWLEVMSGVARIEVGGVDQFVPQMVNFELVGGVNFAKGCYPGQEVVARSQYRGTLKRRAFVLHGAQAMAAGQEVFASTDPGQPAGMVVNAAAVPGSDGWSALVELKLNALDATLHLGAADGPVLTLGQLPYPLPSAEDDEA